MLRRDCSPRLRRCHLYRSFDRERGRITFQWEDFHIMTTVKFKRLPYPMQFTLDLGVPLEDGKYRLWIPQLGIDDMCAKNVWYHCFYKYEAYGISVRCLAINWNTWNCRLGFFIQEKNKPDREFKVLVPLNFIGIHPDNGVAVFRIDKRLNVEFGYVY